MFFLWGLFLHEFASVFPIPVASGPGKIQWKAADVRALAIEIKQSLPLSVAQVLGNESWKGGALVQLEDTIATPKAEDVLLNFCWVAPVVKKFRDKVPSQFYLADTFLYMDKLYQGRLLVPTEAGESKTDVATHESKKLKMLVGALRTLWRSSILF